MDIGLIGYGSMGKMLAEKFASSGISDIREVFVSNRSSQKLAEVPAGIKICKNNRELAQKSDIVFLCVRPSDMKDVLTEIKDAMRENTLLVSLNGSVSFKMIAEITDRKTAKVVPGVTAEIGCSQTLVCYNSTVPADDKEKLEMILGCFGDVIVLPEQEIGMGAELVSCMPGFIAALFDVICRSAGKHTELSNARIMNMVLNTMGATAELMLRKGLSFEEVVTRVATKGGITEEGTKVIYEMFPRTADEIFEKTLEKRRLTAQNAERSFRQ